MPLHPQARAFLQFIAQSNAPSITTLDPVRVRQMDAEFVRGFAPARPEPIDRLETLTLPIAPDGIRVRLYAPAAEAALPILVYFHGGGWVLGSPDNVDPLCRTLANRARCLVASVDYRLAPEFKFPRPAEDAYAATDWIVRHATKLGGDPQRIAVGGDSAGGNLAAVTALMSRDRGDFSLVYQLLLYPVTHYNFETPSYLDLAEGYGLKREEMIWFWHHYLSAPADGHHPYASPLLAPNLSHLPPAHVVTAEYDVLRDEAEAYADRLRQAGVSVTQQRYLGTIHGFIGMAEILETGREAIAQVSDRLQRALHQGNG